jgi:hypothetical protein
MINPFKEVNWKPGLPEKRSFARSLIIGFPCVALGLIVINRLATGGWHPNGPLWLGGIGMAVGVVLYALPMIAKPFYLVWYFVSCCIGIVVSNVLLAAFFYSVVTPFGLLKGLMGKNNLSKSFDRQSKTYWKDSEPVTDPSRYYRQF